MRRKHNSSFNRTNGRHSRDARVYDHRRRDQKEEESTMRETHHTRKGQKPWEKTAGRFQHSPQDYRDAPKAEKHDDVEFDPEFDPDVEQLLDGIDESAVGTGLIIADLFKVCALATAYLPNIELRTEDFSVIVDEDSITVRITGLSPNAADTDCCEGKRRSSGNGMTGHSHRNDCGCEEDDWNPEEDDEEEKVYDEY